MQKGLRAAGRPDQDHDVHVPDVDAQLQRAAGKADRRLGVAELLLDLLPAPGVDVGIMDVDRPAERRAPTHGGGVGLDLRPGVAEDQRLAPAPGSQGAQVRDQGVRAIHGKLELLGVDRAPAAHLNDAGRGEIARGDGCRVRKRRRQGGILERGVGGITARAGVVADAAQAAQDHAHLVAARCAVEQVQLIEHDGAQVREDPRVAGQQRIGRLGRGQQHVGRVCGVNRAQIARPHTA